MCCVFHPDPIKVYVFHNRVPENPIHPVVKEPNPEIADHDAVAPEGGGSDIAENGDKGEDYDLTKGYKPPNHVTTGTVYSNAYRKSLATKKDKEVAKADAKKASHIFQVHGLVTPDLCGKFQDKPRKKRSVLPDDGEPGEMQVEPCENREGSPGGAAKP